MSDEQGEFDGIDIGDDYDYDEPTDAVEGTDRVAAHLADDSGYLVIGGENAGSVVPDVDNTEVHHAAALRDRDEALDGDAPLFLVHRPYRHWRLIPRLLAQLHAMHGENLALGTISKLPVFSQESHVEFGDLCGAASLRIVDPDACYREAADLRLQPPSERKISRAPYLGEVDSSIEEILEMQRVRGSNLLLTPGYALNYADPEGSLDALCRVGDEALAALKPGERLALNVTASAAWLSERPLLEALLAQLLDQEQFGTWYVRVQWRNVRTQAQPIDMALLRGYRRLAELAADEDRRLLLPQTGLTGWFMLAFGATGFGTGPGGTTQAFREESGGGRPGSRIERYFERQLIHVVERFARSSLTRDPLYEECTCPYCPALFGNESWPEEYEGLHHVFGTGVLTADVAPVAAGRAGTHGAVRRLVRSARRFSEGKVLTGLSSPRHLDVWDRIL